MDESFGFESYWTVYLRNGETFEANKEELNIALELFQGEISRVF